jgi:spore germination protein YaaH
VSLWADAVEGFSADSVESLFDSIPTFISTAHASSGQAGSETGVQRYAFLVNWDPASAASLRANLDSIDVLIPEWLHLNHEGDVVIDNPELTEDLLDDIRQADRVPEVMPLVNNYFDGAWRGDVARNMLVSAERRMQLIDQLIGFTQSRGLAGVTLDFQDLDPQSASFDQLLEELYDRFSDAGLKVGITIPLEGSHVDGKTLADLTDFVVVMAYDHSVMDRSPGPIAPQPWVEGELRARIAEIGPNEVVLGIANYGYGWHERGPAPQAHTVHEVWRRAEEAGAEIRMDPLTLNPTFTYHDHENRLTQVWYLDAVTAYNQVRAVKDLSLKGVALWRMGSEDPAIWSVFDELSSTDPSELSALGPSYGVTYHGMGEVLKVVSTPEPGLRTVSWMTRQVSFQVSRS